MKTGDYRFSILERVDAKMYSYKISSMRSCSATSSVAVTQVMSNTGTSMLSKLIKG